LRQNHALGVSLDDDAPAGSCRLDDLVDLEGDVGGALEVSQSAVGRRAEDHVADMHA
jgi:hypothetical protein